MSMTNEQIQPLHQNIGVLRAMASNYAAGRHCWDHLDGEAVSRAADDIDALLAERDADKALIDVYSDAYKEALRAEAVNWEAAASLAEENAELKRRIAELEARTHDAWIEHDGKWRPDSLRTDELVYLKTRKQELKIPYPAGKVKGWMHTGGDMDVMAYKLAEARTLTVKLPPRAPENLASVLDGYEKWLVATTFRDTWNACLAEVTRFNDNKLQIEIEVKQ